MSVNRSYHCTTFVKAVRLWWKLRKHYACLKPCRTGWVVATVTGPSVNCEGK